MEFPIQKLTALTDLFIACLGYEKTVKEEFTGKEAKPGQFPFAIRLYSRLKDSSMTYCTAVIITFDKLLSAGHCCHRNAKRFAVVGDPDQTEFVHFGKQKNHKKYRVREVLLHPNFERTQEKLVNDLCLLFLEEPINPEYGHEPIEISYESLSGKKNCTALGWGTNFGYRIQHKLYYKDAIAYKCNLRFGNSTKFWFVCLEPHAVCPGDSGSPLLCDGKLYGIASFFLGHGGETNPKCEEGVIDYYTELSTQKDFIETISNSAEILISQYSVNFVITVLLTFRNKLFLI